MGTSLSRICGSNKDIEAPLLGTSMNLDNSRLKKRQDKLGNSNYFTIYNIILLYQNLIAQYLAEIHVLKKEINFLKNKAVLIF